MTPTLPKPLLTRRTVRYRRRKAGLTQWQLAKLAGVGRATIQNIERGKDSLDSTLKAIADALGCEYEPEPERADDPVPAPATSVDAYTEAWPRPSDSPAAVIPGEAAPAPGTAPAPVEPSRVPGAGAGGNAEAVA